MSSNTPGVNAPDWDAAQGTPWLTENKAKRMIEALARAGVVEDRDLTAPPGSCGDGACYLVKATATGLWAGHAGEMAIAVGTNAASGWYFVPVAKEGTLLWIKDEDVRIRYSGSAWVNDVTGIPFIFEVAASDEATALSVTAAAVTFEWPADVLVTAIYSFITGAAASSGPVMVDVNDDGVSLFSTRPMIDIGENSSRNGTVPAVLTTPAGVTVLAGSVMTVDIDEPGDSATGLKITFIGTYVL